MTAPQTVKAHDESSVHCLSGQPFLSACGRDTRELRYKVTPRDFGRLTTPPAPFCMDCTLALAKARP